MFCKNAILIIWFLYLDNDGGVICKTFLAALYLEDKLSMEIRGRDILTGLPRSITVTSSDVTEALQNELEAIISAAKKVLHMTPPSLS